MRLNSGRIALVADQRTLPAHGVVRDWPRAIVIGHAGGTNSKR
ncbi:hypothetical protein [Nitrospira sp. Nam80]